MLLERKEIRMRVGLNVNVGDRVWFFDRVSGLNCATVQTISWQKLVVTGGIVISWDKAYTTREECERQTGIQRRK